MNIDLKGLIYGFKSQSVLQSIDASFGPGEIIGLVGPNGSGKTTFLRCLAGLLTTKGMIFYDQEPLELIPIRQRASIFSFVAQNEHNDFPYSVAQIVRMGRAYKTKSFSTDLIPSEEGVVQSILEEFDLAAMSSRGIQSLSGGEWQRVMLARAFAQESRVTLLDEPTSALDLRHQVGLMKSLRKRAIGQGLAIVSLHDLNLAASVCDRVMLLSRGKVIELGPPRCVFTKSIIESVYNAPVSVDRDASGALHIRLELGH